MPLERRFFDSTNDVPGAIHEDGQLLLLQRKQFKINKVYFGGARVCFDYAIKFAQLDALRVGTKVVEGARSLTHSLTHSLTLL